MTVRNFDSFTCVRYCQLAADPLGDFLDQLQHSKLILIFKNDDNYDAAIWIPEIGIKFIDDDIFEEGLKFVPLDENDFGEEKSRLLLYSAYCKDDVEDINDILNDRQIKVSYKNEMDKSKKFAHGFIAICSKTEGLDIQIDEDFNDEVFINNKKLPIDEVFGSFDEDDTWVLAARNK